jgi:hypothetical protein
VGITVGNLEGWKVGAPFKSKKKRKKSDTERKRRNNYQSVLSSDFQTAVELGEMSELHLSELRSVGKLDFPTVVTKEAKSAVE